MNGIPQIRNPLDGVNFASDFLNMQRGIPQPDRSADLLQVDLFGGLEDTINENLPSYLVGIVGLVLIGAGIYSLAK